MRVPAFIALAALFTCISACAGGQTTNSGSAPTPPLPVPATPMVSKDGNYDGRGLVTKIDLSGGSVELDHEEIPGLMPRMIMEFYVKEPEQLKPLKVGDKVDFVLEYKFPEEKIVSIRKAK